ncbi:hypothetical protein AB6T38_05550 [Aliiglaciecola sp. SL4]|uniref:hypothetical protein n=1 Tax=Aliiglaciecola sp. SL4 TaxID=3239806 RepID=UPI00355B19DF
MQFTAIAVPALNLPMSLNGIVFFLISIGFPIALFLAWAFELTPEGVKSTINVEQDESIAKSTGRKLDFLIIGLLSIIIIYLIAANYIFNGEDDQEQSTQSIAVLPFVNMSSDPEQEYFSDGISEELLNLLAQIPKLQVAGRTSSFAFKDKNEDLREIGDALNVKHILEGSVRKSGTKLRITAQLIQADNGYHLWSETYDRELSDVFKIQDEIARNIVEALKVKLGADDIKVLNNQPTTNLDAHDAYLRAWPLYHERDSKGLLMAISLFEKATKLDPQFVEAWAMLADSYAMLYIYGEQEITKQQVAEEMGRCFVKILQIGKTTWHVHSAIGVYYSTFTEYSENESYLHALEQALALNPNSSLVLARLYNSVEVMPLTELTSEIVDTSYARAQKAYRLDPLSWVVVANLVTSLIAQEKFGEAEQLLLNGNNYLDIDEFFLVNADLLGRISEQLAIDLKTNSTNMRSRFSLLDRLATMQLWEYSEKIPKTGIPDVYLTYIDFKQQLGQNATFNMQRYYEQSRWEVDLQGTSVARDNYIFLAPQLDVEFIRKNKLHLQNAADVYFKSGSYYLTLNLIGILNSFRISGLADEVTKIDLQLEQIFDVWDELNFYPTIRDTFKSIWLAEQGKATEANTLLKSLKITDYFILDTLKYLPSRYAITETPAYKVIIENYNDLLDVERAEFKQRWQELGLDELPEVN